MKDNPFFKPTPLYKEFMILDMVHKNEKITQRAIADALSISVSMVNGYLDAYEDEGYIERKHITKKTVRYLITTKGAERKKHLNIVLLNSAQKIYYIARENIITFLKFVWNKGFKKVLFYGAGEVAEIMLHVIQSDSDINLDVVGLVDDDDNKIGNEMMGLPIFALKDINDVKHEGIIVSSHAHNTKIINKLRAFNYDESRIVTFFS